MEAPPPSAAPSSALRKGPWTAEEDAILIEHVRKNGEGNWNSVQKVSSLSRCGKSCRLRWANHLRPNLKKGQLTPEEELTVLRLHSQMGNKWARMAAQLPGRTDNEIKNYWNTRVKRRQRAGLPLYPPGLLQRNVRRPPQIAIPSSYYSSSPLTSPMMFDSAGPVMFREADIARGMKRARDDVGVDFSFPSLSSPACQVMPRMWHTAPSTPTGATVFDYGMTPSMSMPSLLLPMPMPMQPSTTGYHSSGGVVHVLDGGGGVELMDKLLQEAERVAGGGGQSSNWPGEATVNNGISGQDAFLDSVVDLAGLDCNTGPISTSPMMSTDHCNIPVSVSVSDLYEMTTPTQPPVSDLYDMTTPTQPMPMPSSDWTNCDNNSMSMSNGGPSALTERSMPSCHWSIMPELV